MDFSKLLYSPQANAVQPVPVPTSGVGQLQPADIAAAPPVQGPADFNTVVNNPVQSIMSAKPASTPEEVAQRKSQWSQVLDAFQKDPNLQATLLYMGTQMMQPMGPGQTTAGHIGQSIQGGMNFLASREELDRKRGMENKRFELETKQAESQIKGRDAQTAAQEYELAEKQKTEGIRMKQLDLNMQKAEAEIANIADERDLRKVQKRIALMQEEMKAVEMGEFMRPEMAAYRDRIRQLDEQSKRAEITLRQRQAANVGVTAPDATDKLAQAKYNDPAWRAAQGLPEGTSMETYKRLAQEEASKDAKTYNTSKSSSVQGADKYEEVYRRGNPKRADETTAQYDARVATAVRMHMDDAAKLYAQTEYEVPSWMKQDVNPYAANAPVSVAPQKPEDRVTGMRYRTPKGDLVWTGTGWRP